MNQGSDKIQQLYCFAVTDDDGNEGVPAVSKDGMMLPLMGADMERMDSMRPFMREFEKQSGKKVRLYKFTERMELDWW